MKRNLSSHAIKAMAIGMAVMLGSTTAISGVVKGSVVEAYAAGDMTANITNPSTDFSSIDTSSYIVTPEGLLFKVKTPGAKAGSGASNDDGTVTLVGTVTQALSSSETATDGHNVPYKGNIESNKLSIKTSDYASSSAGSEIKFEIEEIGDGTNPLAVATISNSAVPDFSSYNTPSTIDGSLISSTALTIDDSNGLTIKGNAFKGVTLTNTLTLSGKINVEAKAFAGIKGTDSNIDLSGAAGGTINGKAFSDETGTEKSIYGTLKLPTFTSEANSFNNVDVTTLLEFTGTATLTTAASFKPGTGGNTINELKLPVAFNGGVDDLFAVNSSDKYTITNLNLESNTDAMIEGTFNNTKITTLTHNGKTKMKGSTIDTLNFGSGVTQIEADTFKNATITNDITIPDAITNVGASAFESANIKAQGTITMDGVKTIGSKAFEIASPSTSDAINVSLKGYENADLGNIQKDAFGSQDTNGQKYNIELKTGTQEGDRKALEDKLKDAGTSQGNDNVTVSIAKPAVAPTVTDGVVNNENPLEITLTFSENIKAAAGEPTATDFTVKVDGQPNVVTKLSEITTSAKGNTLTLTLTTPVAQGQEVKVSYSKTGNAITNDAGTELAKFDDKVVTNNVGQQQGSTIEVTSGNNKYTFQITSTEGTKTVALSGFEKVGSKGRARRDVSRAVSFSAGKVNVGGVDYTLTKIGTGTPLTNIDDKALQGHTDAVTEIAPNAFKDNKSVNTLSFPKVTKVGASAFANSSVKSVDLGSGVDKQTPVNIPSDVFKGASNVTSIKTNENSSSKNNAINAANGSSSSNVTVGSGSSSTEVKPGGGSGSGSGGSGSSGSSSSGSGANIGTSVDNSNANNNNNQNNNNNNNSNNVTTPVVEDKQLSLDVISLPSVEGEAKAFGDISADYWAKSYIDKLSTAGIINGINGNFQPNGQTKRADVTIMLVKLLGLAPQNNNKFTDVNANAYYAPYVGAASTYGIVNGSNGMFNPEGIISRQDTMVMIGQILKSLNLNVNTDATALSKFSDLSKVAPYAQESVAILVNSGIITGNNGKLNPTAPVTRAEMATIMSKLYDVLAAANK